MRKTITILNVTKRYTKNGKGVNQVIADDGQTYTVWDPDFAGQLKRNATITGDIGYGVYNNVRTQILREPKDYRRSYGRPFGGNSYNQDILLNILAVLILSAQKSEVSESSVETLVNGLKRKFGILPPLNEFSNTPSSNSPSPEPPIKTIQVEDEAFEENEDEEIESPVPVFKENMKKTNLF